MQKVLNQQLTNHIREVLPELKTKLQKQLGSLEKEVATFKGMEMSGSGVFTIMVGIFHKSFYHPDPNMKTKVMVQMINNFSQTFENQIEVWSNVEIRLKTQLAIRVLELRQSQSIPLSLAVVLAYLECSENGSHMRSSRWRPTNVRSEGRSSSQSRTFTVWNMSFFSIRKRTENNLLGIRAGLFTPDQAFDVVTREMIAKLKVFQLSIESKFG